MPKQKGGSKGRKSTNASDKARRKQCWARGESRKDRNVARSSHGKFKSRAELAAHTKSVGLRKKKETRDREEQSKFLTPDSIDPESRANVDAWMDKNESELTPVPLGLNIAAESHENQRLSEQGHPL